METIGYLLFIVSIFIWYKAIDNLYTIHKDLKKLREECQQSIEERK